MEQINYFDFISSVKLGSDGLRLINIRGANGAGKSTVPMQMMETDPLAFELTYHYYGKNRIMATVFPSYNYMVVGKYRGLKCGGLDTFRTTEQIFETLDLLWEIPYNLIMEGVISSTVFSTYKQWFETANDNHVSKRNITVASILPTEEVCINRVMQRNGGKEVKIDLIRSKYRSVERNHKKFCATSIPAKLLDNSNVAIEDTLKWFFGMFPNDQFISQELKKTFESSNFTSKNRNTKLYLPTEEEISKYEWAQFYKEPDSSVKISQKYFDTFWYFMYERLKIYHKRVVKRQSYPWSQDEVFNKYKFTNISRDMDKLSIYERKHILSKLDETVDDLELRKKSVLLNIMIFRLFVKIETYEAHGFIDLARPNYKQVWKRAQDILLSRREKGYSNFTSAFWVNGFHTANRDPNSVGNKTYNAIQMINSWIENIDEIYEKAIVKSKNMKEQLEYFGTLQCIGTFTAYEFACSVAETERYCKNPLVPWSQDSYTSVGPGAQRGLQWIFKSLGNLSEFDALIYLRSIWQYEMKRLGYYDEFIKYLPKVFKGDIDLRVIEHCLCETQKYNKVQTNTGRPRETFSMVTKDTSLLTV